MVRPSQDGTCKTEGNNTCKTKVRPKEGSFKNNNYVGCRPHTTRHFCFGKRTQNHSRLCAALRVPPPPYRIRWLRNSLRSNNLRREVDSVRRLRRAQRENPYPRQKMKEQAYITIECHFERSGKSPPSVEREISPKGRNDNGRGEGTEGKTWIPDC